MGKFLVIAGAALMAVGVLVMWGVPFGRLPGDLMLRRGSVSFYFPLTTSILISVALTLLLMFLRR